MFPSALIFLSLLLDLVGSATEPFLSAARRDALQAINSARSVVCPDAPTLYGDGFVLKKWGPEGNGETLNLQLRSTLGDDITIQLRGKDGTRSVQQSSTFEMLISVPKPCDMRAPYVDAAHRLRSNATLVLSSLQWAEQQINMLRREKCPSAGSALLSPHQDAQSRIIAGVEVSILATVHMKSEINIPGDDQLKTAEHRIVVRWEPPVQTSSASPRRLRRGAAGKSHSSNSASKGAYRAQQSGTGAANSGSGMQQNGNTPRDQATERVPSLLFMGLHRD
jgi:hypothetical protein